MESFELAVQKACQVFGVEKLFCQQFEALKTFVSSTDVFLNSGNPLCSRLPL